jgi:hypothetical protein
MGVFGINTPAVAMPPYQPAGAITGSINSMRTALVMNG